MNDLLGNMKKSCTCGELKKKNVNKQVVLMGWVQRRRDHGGVIFVDLRDRKGITQIVFNPEINKKIHIKAQSIRSEYVLGVIGKVVQRPDNMVNSNMPTGDIEVLVDELKILNTAETPAFQIEENVETSESVRLKHRHLDLRRPRLQKNILTRHKVSMVVRDYLNKNGFIDIETPFLTKSTPEGARDYLVPSRINQGHFMLYLSPLNFLNSFL